MRTPRVPFEPRTTPEPFTLTLNDGYTIRGRVWRPAAAGGIVDGEQRTRTVVLYQHGIQSHGGWFEWSAALLAEGGAGVILPDRRGSGLNGAERGDTPSAERWLADLDELWDWAQRELGARRVALVGVSWGGKPAVLWAARHPDVVPALLLIAPGVFPAVDVGVAGRLRVGAALLLQPTRRLPIPLNDPALFTANPAGREFIAADPLKLTEATARFFYASARLDRMLARLPARSLRPPVTLLLAGRDLIIRNDPTVRWLTRIAACEPTVHTFADAHHTLEFESQPEAFVRVLNEWCPCGPARA